MLCPLWMFIMYLRAFKLNVRFQTTQGSCFSFRNTVLTCFSILKQFLKSDIQYLLSYLSKLGATFDKIGNWREMVAYKCMHKRLPKANKTRQQKSAHSSAVKEVCRQYSFALHIITPCANCATVIWDFFIQPVHLPYFFTQRGQIHWVCGQYHSHIQTEWANFQSTQCSGVKHWTEVLFCNQLHCISIFFATGG